MPTSKEERDRILALVEVGQVSALQAAQLLDALAMEPERLPKRPKERIVRLRATCIQARQQKVNFIASMPVGLLRIGSRLGARLLPQLSESALEDLLHDIESGATGRLLDIQDLEQGERLEIFVE